MKLRQTMKFLYVLLFIESATCYFEFQKRIPNGEIVPHPCNINYIWEGVGHNARGGGGDRNLFGVDFEAYDKTWTKALCEKDSDMDGLTNGQELGDPNCVWTPGTEPTRRTGLSHPGFCGTSDEAKCFGLSTADCKTSVFTCDAINDEGTEKKTIRIPQTPVPAKTTTYQCMVFDFPSDKDYHVTAFTPHVDNKNILHHIIIYGCKDTPNQSTRHNVNEPWECFMSSEPLCNEFVAIWAVGFDGTCMHENCGFRVGPQGYKKGVIEMHWNNPEKITDYTDSSGMNFYVTANRRPHDCGILMVGQQDLQIPPQRERYSVSGSCDLGLCEKLITDPVNVWAVTNHMHYLGSAASTVLTTENKVHYIAHDETYSYDRPVIHMLDDEVVMSPGDKLNTTCHFRSMSRFETTKYGEGTQEEMCFAFVMYYPKQHITKKQCVAFDEIQGCEYDSPIVRGCNVTMMLDPGHQFNTDTYTSVFTNCTFGECSETCLSTVKEIYQHPCYTEPMLSVVRKFAMEYSSNDSVKLLSARFYGSLQSCDAEIARESFTCLVTVDFTNSASCVKMSLLMTLFSVALLILL